MVEIYGADASCFFVLFAAPVENELVWNEAGIEGAVRFLQRVWRFVFKWREVLASADPNGGQSADASPLSRKLRQKTHQTIRRIDQSLENLQFNTPVAAMMELANELYESGLEPETSSPAQLASIKEALTSLVIMLTPFAPHAAEEMHAALVGNDEGMLANGARFPVWDAEAAKADQVEIAVQVNGKLRSRIYAAPDASSDDLETLARADAKVVEFTSGKAVKKVIVVPGRLVNIVVQS